MNKSVVMTDYEYLIHVTSCRQKEKNLSIN